MNYLKGESEALNDLLNYSHWLLLWLESTKNYFSEDLCGTYDNGCAIIANYISTTQQRHVLNLLDLTLGY